MTLIKRTPAEIVAFLDALTDEDPEVAHDQADDALLTMVPVEVAEAYIRAASRVGFWYA